MKKIKEYLKKIPLLKSFVRFVRENYKYPYDVYFKSFVFSLVIFGKRFGILKKDSYLYSLKDKYKGKRLFIVATGPSLTIDDLEKLNDFNEISISVNSIFKLLNKTKWKPTYYVMDDLYLIDRYSKQGFDGNYCAIPKEKCLFSYSIRHFLSIENQRVSCFFNMNYLDHWYTCYSKRFKYNRDFSEGVYDFYTVTNTAILLADYMGAKEIYLIGVDNNFGTVGDYHAGEIIDDIENHKKQAIAMKKTENCQRIGFEKLNSLIRKDVSIFNATRGGNLEVFPRVCFDDLFEKKLKVKL